MFDVSAHELPEGIPSVRLPLLVLYRHDNKAEPLQYNGRHSVDQIMLFLKENCTMAFNTNVYAGEELKAMQEVQQNVL